MKKLTTREYYHELQHYVRWLYAHKYKPNEIEFSIKWNICNNLWNGRITQYTANEMCDYYYLNRIDF